MQHIINLWNSLPQDAAMFANLGGFKRGLEERAIHNRAMIAHSVEHETLRTVGWSPMLCKRFLHCRGFEKVVLVLYNSMILWLCQNGYASLSTVGGRDASEWQLLEATGGERTLVFSGPTCWSPMGNWVSTARLLD